MPSCFLISIRLRLIELDTRMVSFARRSPSRNRHVLSPVNSRVRKAVNSYWFVASDGWAGFKRSRLPCPWAAWSAHEKILIPHDFTP